MRNAFTNFFSPPLFQNNENKTRSAVYVHWISLAFMAAILLYVVSAKIFAGEFSFNFFDVILLFVFAVLYIIWGLSSRGYVRQAGFALIAILWVAVNGTAWIGAGVRDPAYTANFAVLLAAGLLLGWRSAVSISAITILTGIGLAYAETLGISPSVYTSDSPLIEIQSIAVVFVIFAVFIFLLINGLENAIKRAQAGKDELEVAIRDLNTARLRLEENRNQLIVVNDELKQRVERINAIANIAKTVTLVQELERLLPSIVTTISERFRYYHVGIYLLDENKQNAFLRASSSEGGLRMMRRNYKVKVGPEGIVGLVSDRGEARLAYNDSSEPSRLGHEDLPEWNTQLVLPLKVREIVIGALDIQSIVANAFATEDVATLQILADQVAIAIQNARSSAQAKDALQKAEIASRQLTGKAWQEYARTVDRKGYRYDGVKPEPLTSSVDLDEADNPLTIPLNLRGQVIGRLKLKPSEPSHRWTDDEIAMAEATAERVTLALESARLLEEAQQRAQRETFLSEVSTKLGASFQLDSILRDTVEELGQTFRNSTVSFQLVNPAESKQSGGTGKDSAHAPGNGKDPLKP